MDFRSSLVFKFLLNKSPNFHDFSSLIIETVFYSKQFCITEFTVHSIKCINCRQFFNRYNKQTDRFFKNDKFFAIRPTKHIYDSRLLGSIIRLVLKIAISQSYVTICEHEFIWGRSLVRTKKILWLRLTFFVKIAETQNLLKIFQKTFKKGPKV